MALRQLVAHNLNKENVTAKLAVKSSIAEPLNKAEARTALENVNANKKVINNTSSIPLKKCMPPPAQVLKKPVLKQNELVKKAAVKPVANKPALKRQESILKNVPADVKASDSNKPAKCAFSSSQIVIDPKEEPHMVAEYVSDIFKYLREIETQHPINENFLDGHQTTPKMRMILINWLVEVHINFKLYLETLHLCVAIIDRYLQLNKNVGRGTLQLVGTAALMLASKYEEMYFPQIEDFVYICDDTFSKRQILQMEIDILKRLDFHLGRPLSVHFLRRYSKVAHIGSEQYNLGKYLLELALLEYELSYVPPSLIAAAASCLSIAVCKEVMDISKVWTSTLIDASTYKYSDFKHVMILLAHALVKSETSKYDNIRKKYSSSKHDKISFDHRLKGNLIKKLTMPKK